MNPNRKRRILIIAGETSGDILGADLAKTLYRQNNPPIIEGIGGDHMQQAGVSLLMHCHQLAVVGIVEIIRQFKVIRQAAALIKKRLHTHPPDLLVLIDYPGFNLRMARHAKNAEIKVLYYVSPQIWAWHYRRINIIKQCVDHMAVLFPFEEKIYQKEHIPVSFVGHPLTQLAKPSLTKQQAQKTFNLNPDAPIIGLFPGSRTQEITALLPIIIKSAERIQQSLPNAQFILPVAPNLDINSLKNRIPPLIKLATEKRYDVMNLCDAAIAVSGTVTLELALMKTPMVIIYKTNAITYLLARCLVKTPFIGLCNIVAGQEVAREFIQHHAKPQAIANEIITLLSNSKRHQEALEKLEQVSQQLHQPNAPDQTASIALALITPADA